MIEPVKSPVAVAGLDAEDARLAALHRYQILDTPREPGFDEIAALASAVCGTPIAVVNLIGEGRQFFKAEVGLGVRETPLDSSFCACAILEEEFLLVPDATRDTRFACNPLVAGEPHLKFYAGALLKTAEGHAIGTVCVLDYEPRDLTAVQQQTLRVLAHQVMTQLELRRALRERREEAAFMRSVLASSADCIKVLDLDTRLTFMSEGGKRVMEVGDFNAIRGCPWPDFWQGQGNADAKAAVVAAKAGGVGRFQGGASTMAGNPRWWDVQVTPILDAQGVPEKLLSVSRDITVQKDAERAATASEDRWRSLFTSMHEGFFSAEILRDDEGHAVDVRFLEVNPAFEIQSSLPANQTVGRTIREVIPTIPQWLIDIYAGVVDTGEPATFEVAVPALNRTFEAHGHKEADQRLAVMFIDITERKQAEERRNALIELGDRLRHVTAKADVAPVAADILARTLGLSHVGYGDVDHVRDTVTIADDHVAEGVDRLNGVYPFRSYGSYVDDLKAGRAVFIADATDDPRTAGGSDALAAVGVRSIANIPLMEHGQFVTLFFALKAEPHAWTAEEQAFLRNVADRTRAAIGRLEAEEQQRVLNEELSHRMKNMLAMVLSIATQTLKTVPDREPVEAFEQRIHALSAAHDVLLQQEWTAAPLDAVASAVLRTFAQTTRLKVSGPQVSLGPRATLSVSLLLHELATNATKYGALSNDEGHVGVSWRVDGDSDEGDLVLDWEESGGPPVKEPARRGFGSRLIRLGLVGTGDVDLRYQPTGFRAEMRAPLAQIHQS
ncbi:MULTISPECIES: HWE histidine kinase domain-containing protein [Methylobacterium]|uniref:HWE histidine kinase domain-containing protein n=1 Tax=Methylobacterium TaxID=407 RepID=UPI0022783342|nr:MULTISPECIES: HWE histidine kinase domain-containing protein [Methylobacterium]